METNKEITLGAPPSRLWELFTDESHVENWLANYARIDLGKQIYCLSESVIFVSGRHEVMEVEENAELRLLWFLDGIPSTVRIQFKPENKDSTTVAINHQADDELCEQIYVYSGPGTPYLDMMWDYFLERLRSYLETGIANVDFPYVDPADSVETSILLKADLATVFDSLTQIEHLNAWWGGLGDDAKIELVEGGVYSYGWGTDGPSTIKELIPNQLLAFFWQDKQNSHVEWHLNQVDNDHVKLDFKHLNKCCQRHSFWQLRLGWAIGLFRLKWYLEKAETLDE